MKKILREVEGGVKFLSYHEENGYHYPYIDDRIDGMSKNGPYDKWLWEKYTTEDIFVKETDTVIDCGSFVGAFAIAAAKHGASKVYAIEPSSKNFNCINLNIEHYKLSDKIFPFNIGLGNENANLRLNISSFTCENSFLKCDMGATGEYEEVKVKTLNSFIMTNKIKPCNLYLKVEAEGFEPEVIKGLYNKKPRVIVVDVTDERNSRSPRNNIEKVLSERGYKIRNTKRCLFAY